MKIFENYFLINCIINNALLEYFKDEDVVWILGIEKDGDKLYVNPETDNRSFSKTIEYDEKLRKCVKLEIEKAKRHIKKSDIDDKTKKQQLELIEDYWSYLKNE